MSVTFPLQCLTRQRIRTAIVVSWAHASLLPSGISIGSAAFAWLTGVLITQTDKQILLQFRSVEIEASTSSTVGGNVSSAGWQVTLCDPM